MVGECRLNTLSRTLLQIGWTVAWRYRGLAQLSEDALEHVLAHSRLGFVIGYCYISCGFGPVAQ